MKHIAIIFALLLIVLLSSKAQATWTCHLIDNNLTLANSVCPVDFENDGDLDVAAGGSNLVKLYENNGHQVFTEHTISTVTSIFRFLVAADFDGDGDTDFAGANDWSSAGFYWLENLGNFQFADHAIMTTQHFDDLETADMDDDGDPDLVATYNEHLCWWENSGGANPTFTQHNISFPSGESFHIDDIDEDGDMDIATYYGNLRWLENDGNQNFTLHIIGTYPGMACDLTTADFDQNNTVDIILGVQYKILAFLNNGQQLFTQDTLVESILGPNYLFIEDLDKDGCNDIAGLSDSWNYVYWWESFCGWSFDRWEIAMGNDMCISPGDFNNDNKMDLAYATSSSNIVTWLENELPPQTVKINLEQYETITIPPQGGEVPFDMWIWNSTDSALSFDLWSTLSCYYFENRLISNQVLTLAADTLIYRHCAPFAPGSLREDEYVYLWFVGDFPRNYADWDYIVFYKEEANEEIPMTANATQSLLSNPDVKFAVSPNPFNQTTFINFELPEAGWVKLTIYDITGRETASLITGQQSAGQHQVVWDPEGMPSGVYFVRLEAGNFNQTQKIVLMK